jgi:hypothetical protein
MRGVDPVASAWLDLWRTFGPGMRGRWSPVPGPGETRQSAEPGVWARRSSATPTAEGLLKVRRQHGELTICELFRRPTAALQLPCVPDTTDSDHERQQRMALLRKLWADLKNATHDHEKTAAIEKRIREETDALNRLSSNDPTKKP